MDNQHNTPTPMSYTCSGVDPARSTFGNFQRFEALKQEIRNDKQKLKNIIYPKLRKKRLNHPSSKSQLKKKLSETE